MRGKRPFFFSFLALVLLPVALSAETIQFEAGRLELRGGFTVRTASGTLILAADGGVAQNPAVGAITIPHAGEWHLWVSTRSFSNEPVTQRRFSIRLGNVPIAMSFGGHQKSEGNKFVWEDGGKIELPAGALLVVVGEKNTINAQCSRILLTDEVSEKSPEELFKSASIAKMPPLEMTSYKPVSESSPVTSLGATPAARLANDHLRISFLAGTMDGQPAIVQKIEVRSVSGWREPPTTGGADSYRVVYRPADNDPRIAAVRGHQFPSWDLSYASAVKVSAGGASANSNAGSNTAPWLAGQLSQLRPVSARQVDADTVELSFAPLPIGTLTARWRLIAGQPSAAVDLSFHLAKPGYLSLGYHGALEEDPEKLDFLMMPYLYLGHRFPVEPSMMPSDHTPTPVSLVTDKNISYAVMAEPGIIPFVWPSPGTTKYLLGIRNETGKAQPMIYAPEFGSPESLHAATGTVTAAFRIWAQEGSWIEAYRGIVTQTYNLRDYRVPVAASLSDAVVNLYNLMKDDKGSAWDARAKGSWNIEERNVVTQPSPLSYLHYALLTGDKDFYEKYALPSLETLLSRPEASFTAVGGMYGGEYAHPELPLGGPTERYGCVTYASAYRMLQGASPAFANYCFKPDHAVNSRNASGHYGLFDDELEIYETTGDKQWLAKAIADADDYIARNLTHLPSRDLGPDPFVNVSFTPDWEGLLHIYEVSHEPRFLKAAHDAAYWLMSSIWTQPSIPAGNFTIHPGGSIGDTPLIWWLADRFYRNGFMDRPSPPNERFPAPPKITVPEASVPAWMVSQVGLGLEQPSTYSSPLGKNNWNILMNVWAANLLRLGAESNDDLMRVYARNATIGRFSNYPGYYISLFTNLQEAPDYIYKGPDLTTFYYHHIAPFASYVADYVFSDAEMRSHGHFIFPAARQTGYVWFDSRLRGFAPGKVYGETAWPWIHPTAAHSDNKNVDVVLAHNKETLYAALMNQTNTPQPVTVHFDADALGGGPLDGKKIRIWRDDKPQAVRLVKDSSIQINLPGRGFAVIALDGLNIRVPAHEVAGPAAMPIEPNDANETKAIAGTTLKATGAFIVSPQFSSRELYAFVRANQQQCGGATIVYRVAGGPEQRKTLTQFPCEFSIPLPYDKSKVEWRIEDVKPGTSWK